MFIRPSLGSALSSILGFLFMDSRITVCMRLKEHWNSYSHPVSIHPGCIVYSDTWHTDMGLHFTVQFVVYLRVLFGVISQMFMRLLENSCYFSPQTCSHHCVCVSSSTNPMHNHVLQNTLCKIIILNMQWSSVT